jgi:hypothetical protein
VDGDGGDDEGNKLETLGFAGKEFMANAVVFVLVCPPRSQASSLTREALETWSTRLSNL